MFEGVVVLDWVVVTGVAVVGLPGTTAVCISTNVGISTGLIKSGEATSASVTPGETTINGSVVVAVVVEGVDVSISDDRYTSSVYPFELKVCEEARISVMGALVVLAVVVEVRGEEVEEVGGGEVEDVRKRPIGRQTRSAVAIKSASEVCLCVGVSLLYLGCHRR